MAEPVIVPVQLEVTDIDTTKVSFTDAEKQISKSLSGIKKQIQEVFSGIDSSAINKSLEKSMTSVEKYAQTAEDALLRYRESIIKAGKSTEEYKAAVSEANTAIRNQESFISELSQLGPAVAPHLEEARKKLDELIEARNNINPVDFVDNASQIELDKVANTLKKSISAVSALNNKAEDFNQTAHDNRFSDEYTELLKQAEAYKKKLEELKEKSKVMAFKGATDNQWENLRKDADWYSSKMDDIIKKMKTAANTGKAFRFGEGSKAELRNQRNSFSMAAGNRVGVIKKNAMENESPYTAEYQAALDELDKFEKKVEAIREKSAKMIELGASKKQFASVVYEAEQFNGKIDEAKSRILQMVTEGKAFKFGNGNTDAEMAKITSKSNDMRSALTGVATNAKKAQGGLTALGTTHPKLASILGAVKNIASGFGKALKPIGKVASHTGKVAKGFSRVAKGIINSVKHINIFSKAGNHSHSSMNKGFHKLTKNFLMFGLGFRTAYYAIKRLRNIFIEGFKTMGDQFDEIGKPMMQLTESFNRLKGSLATAFQPLVSVVMPILTRFINYLSTMLEAVGKFTAALTGQGYIYKAVAKNINSVTSAAKDANNELGSYDKLEVINKNDTGYEYEKQNIGATESAVSNFAKMVKDAWAKADFTDVGKYITEQLIKVLDNIESNIIPKVTDLVNRILKSINTFVDGFDAAGIGDKIGSIVNTLVGGLDWEQVGKFFANLNNIVWGFVSGLVNSVDWTLIGQSISTGLTTCLDTLDFNSLAGMISGLTTGIVTVVDNIDWNAVATKLLDGIHTVLQSVGESLQKSDNPLLSAFGGIVTALDEALTILTPPLNTIISALGEILQVILPVISELLPPIAEILAEAVQMVLPVLVEVIKSLMPIVSELVKSILPLVMQILKALQPIFDVFIKSVLPHLVSFLNTFMPLIQSVLGLVGNILEPVGELLALCIEMQTFLKGPMLAILKPIISVIAGLCDILGAVLRPILEAIVGIVKSIKDKIKGPLNSIITMIENFINMLIRGLNKGIQAINKLSFDVPDWVPGIGGKKFGFNLKEIKSVSIPKLAQGAVIPPNREFLAMLGDQKHGTNIEAPLDTIKQALAEVLAEIGGTGREPIILQVNGRVLAKVVWDEQEKRYKQTGQHAMA